ncbi:hypothetical protein Cgig2_005495 [Carnegiea gigantea]|uniref:Sodium/metabolite cotransporter BASS4, chloroplastic n=1 Tax=Carnegiea gigantea TaxID=171969 RepID=A0A9Q1KC44_9CARY|nr:hypothetical protein Cgig2_005495 [Carnegiea gigantea]
MAGIAIRALDFKLSFSSSQSQLRLHSNSQFRINNLQLRRYSAYSIHNLSIILRWQPRFNVSPARAAAASSDPVCLTLRSKEIGEATEAWPAGLFGLASILLLTPVFSRLILQLNLQPREFVTGLALFCCMPTTLSSGVSLTQVPFSISKLVASGVGISIPTKQLFRSLVITLLIPLILGKVLRESIKGVADFADKNRKLLSIMCALFLSLAPWIQVSKSRSLLLMVNPTSFLLAIGLGVLLHFVLLAFNVLSLKILSFLPGANRSTFANRRNAIAVLLVASQKTLPVMVAVVDQLGGALGAAGLLVLPGVAAHLNQIILDSFLVNSLLQEDHPVRGAKMA